MLLTNYIIFKSSLSSVPPSKSSWIACNQQSTTENKIGKKKHIHTHVYILSYSMYTCQCTCVYECGYQCTCSRVYNPEPRDQSSYWFLIPAKPLERCKSENLNMHIKNSNYGREKQYLKTGIFIMNKTCFDLEQKCTFLLVFVFLVMMR